jgi:hypothetical protein
MDNKYITDLENHCSILETKLSTFFELVREKDEVDNNLVYWSYFIGAIRIATITQLLIESFDGATEPQLTFKLVIMTNMRRPDILDLTCNSLELAEQLLMKCLKNPITTTDLEKINR